MLVFKGIDAYLSFHCVCCSFDFCLDFWLNLNSFRKSIWYHRNAEQNQKLGVVELQPEHTWPMWTHVERKVQPSLSPRLRPCPSPIHPSQVMKIEWRTNWCSPSTEFPMRSSTHSRMVRWYEVASFVPPVLIHSGLWSWYGSTSAGGWWVSTNTLIVISTLY